MFNKSDVESLEEAIKRLEQERDELKKAVENQKLEYEELQCDLSEVENACGCYQSENAELKQENKELKKQHYEALKMLKHEYDGRQRDNEQWFTRCTENHNEDSKIIEEYRSALEEIRVIADDTFKVCDDDCGNARKIKLIIDKINEVLNN